MSTVRLLPLLCVLTITLLSINIDVHGADPDSTYCKVGLCRKDQILDALHLSASSTQHADSKAFTWLVSMAPADAYAWAAISEYANASGASRNAREAIDRAVELAPEAAPIRMRRANYCFETGDKNCVLYDGKAIMQRSASYDRVLFLYYKTMTIELEDVLKLGLPEEPRAAQGWAIYVSKDAKDANSSIRVLRTWGWLRERGFADPSTACRLTRELVQRRDVLTAWRVWSDCRESGACGSGDASDLMTNAQFARNPLEAPFDWSLRPQPGVDFRRGEGLEVRFEGETNLSMANVRQMSVVRPGQHRLTVDVAQKGLTTDQGPIVRLFDVEEPNRLAVQTEMFRGSAGRRTIMLDFVVPPGSRLVTVQLERRPSEKFDNKIAGTLHLYRVSLTEINEQNQGSPSSRTEVPVGAGQPSR